MGAVGFCYEPETHLGKHPSDTFVLKLTDMQRDEIRRKALQGSQDA